jgi:hypothetical protein
VSALGNNTTGQLNTAIGASALLSNTEGNSNTAYGVSALDNNTIGQLDTAIGASALGNNTVGNGNVAVGFEAGAFLTGNNNIDIGVQVRGLPSERDTIRIGNNLPPQGQSNCYIGGMWDGHISGKDGFVVLVNADNKLGTIGFSGSTVRLMDVIQDLKKVAELEAVVAALAAQVEEQAVQLQKIGAQIQIRGPMPKTVLNNQ